MKKIFTKAMFEKGIRITRETPKGKFRILFPENGVEVQWVEGAQAWTYEGSNLDYFADFLNQEYENLIQ